MHAEFSPTPEIERDLYRRSRIVGRLPVVPHAPPAVEKWSRRRCFALYVVAGLACWSAMVGIGFAVGAAIRGIF